MRYLYVVVAGLMLSMVGCRGCIDQHDPRPDWKKFENESANANRAPQKLTDDGKLPAPAVAVDAVAANPADEKYANFCAGCHGATGAGDGPAGAGLNPKPRNFVTWNDPNVTDEYIAKVIRDGGPAVGKSPLMAPWGGVLGEEGVKEMVAKVRSFKK